MAPSQSGNIFITITAFYSMSQEICVWVWLALYMSIPDIYPDTREMNTGSIPGCSGPTVRKDSIETPLIA